MKTFLFVSNTGDSLALAQKVKAEGNKVYFYVNDGKYIQVGDGLVDKSPVVDMLINKEGFIERTVLDKMLKCKPDIIFIDTAGNGFGRLADTLKRENYKVIGSSAFSDQIEFDDSYAIMLMEIYKINIPSPQLLSSEVVEISTEVWFDGINISDPIFSFDELQFMEHNIGPMIDAGGMGTVMWKGSKECKLYQEGIGKIAPYLRKINYRGPLSFYTLITKNSLYGMGLYARPRMINVFTILEGLKGKVSEFLEALVNPSEIIANMQFKSQFMMGVRFVVKPFPLTIPQKINDNLVIEGLNEGNLKHLWFLDVLSPKEGTYVCTGATGNLGCITARGESVREAQRRVYRTMENLDIFEVMYRRDIGNRFHSSHQALKDWGWL